MSPVIIFDNYELSPDGQIKNLKSGRILKAHLGGTGYLSIRCGAKNKTTQVHTLVAKQFVPNPNNKPQVNHKDGNKLNNHYSNLEWVTASENIQHMFDTGLWKRKADYKVSKGSNHYLTKLKESDIVKIRELHATGNFSYAKIGEMYGVCLATIGYIIQRKTWKHI